ncbi:hypothetical protein BATDEDRAFT_28626 [Batrachochytrium dendrobatidis JAM81]|uniref:Aminopeptidase n=1 Tax=Batrachochytrium dendrobatidis (strain JAM81 / FGSC 10211) TaxID=684364 RepID=F4PEK9_BATDJ|nr:uncharacterized protein BATDEDRAFT_28626 [Batrachochytrium dendrobatidis JAM81]EGF76262.1 hypothetical protein BATDEDRAFT_28626 [Batrachochytrium dendrobatidis JAM81]KAJ8323682.1 hypothetical protein O5D80_007570 [Batrachochytrium dendrobatidis]KAK5666399.1 hypothetical protein QVD99_007154 [Batrachochytrium dendrobatidis]|eukprot:XP_006683050.1 hypothetical protein BATDEDRAFT_28626 [Batrachochytrium dendrobatidis JAM81]
MCNNGPLQSGSSTSREVLPTNVKPSHYSLSITPNFESFEFAGHVQISLDVKEETSTIVANANELNIKSASIVVVHVKTETTQTAKAITLDKKKETVTFEFETPLPAGAKVELTVDYTGIHNDQMAGFYRSSYTGKDDVKKHLVVTQFEATDCRRAIPCWDEPNLKATFDVKLIVDPVFCALSNMNQTEERTVQHENKSLKEITFARTPIMSTYLLAMAVGDFEYIETMAQPKMPANAKPITVRVYTLKGQSHLGKFALDVGARTLEYFSEYFDLAYPLPKMDMIAIPDFGAGAMENWGLVTYREVMLLVDENTSAPAKQGVAYVVGHELAHQWFGNLVTMDWWSELWLNEGFATFVGWLATDNIFPEWKVWTQFVTGDYSKGMGLDSMRSSHPIEVDVQSPAEINQIFDAISYSKGASVIRMLSSFLTTEIFSAGVRIYLKKFAYSNATTLDLWAALSEVSGHDVAKLMYSWTRTMGYPILSVTNEEFDESKQELTLTVRQSRFLSSGDLTPDEDASSLWTVPLTIVTHVNPHSPTRHVLTEKETKITFPYSHENNFFWKFNYRSNGFYRTNLDTKQQAHLGAALAANLSLFTTEDRIGIISDAFATAKSGNSSTAGALDISRGFVAEEDFIVLSELSANVASVSVILLNESEEVRNGIDMLKRYLFSPKAKASGFEYSKTEGHLAAMKRTLVIAAAADAKDPVVIKELIDRFHKFVGGDESALDTNLRSIAYRTACKNTDDESVFEALLNIYKTSTNVEARLTALSTLGASPNINVVNRVLNEVLMDGNLVRLQDMMYPLNSLRSSPALKEVLPIMWNFLKSNWPVLYERLKPSLGLLGASVQLCVSGQIGNAFADEVEAWSRGDELATDEEKATRVEQLKAAQRPLNQSIERVRSSTKWLERDRETIQKWIESNKTVLSNSC